MYRKTGGCGGCSGMPVRRPQNETNKKFQETKYKEVVNTNGLLKKNNK